MTRFSTFIQEIYRMSPKRVGICLCICILLLGILARFLLKAKWGRMVLRLIALIGSAVSVYAILYLTILDRRGSGIHYLELRPFYSLVLARTIRETYRTLLMNIYLFVPAGMMLPFLFLHRKSPYGRRGSSPSRCTASDAAGSPSFKGQHAKRNSVKKRGSSSRAAYSLAPAFLTVLGLFLFSILIEYVQYRYALGRAETDDVLCNTLGAALGMLSYLIAVIRSKSHALL